jgi:folate-binding protein YgfZ
MEDEVQFMRNGAGFFTDSSRGRPVVTGGDRVRFLQGQLTQNIEAIEDWRGAYSTIVNGKGRMEADCWVYRMPDEILLDTSEECGEKIRQRLEKFIIADDVEVLDISRDVAMVSIIGPRAPEIISGIGQGWVAPGEGSIVMVKSDEFGEIYLACPSKRLGSQVDVLISWDHVDIFAAALNRIAASFHAGWVTCAGIESWRILSGVPRYGVDLTEENLPPEAGLEQFGISYRKGCYIGQEVLNRLRAMGSVTRRWVGFELDGILVPDPTHMGEALELWADSRLVGKITSAATFPHLGKTIALGMVKKKWWDPGTVVEWRQSGTVGSATVVPPGWR